MRPRKGGGTLLCLPNADHRRSDRWIGRPPHPSRGNRASGDHLHPAMACRSWQRLPGDTACRSVSAASANRASRGNREELARVARNTPACLSYRPDRTHRRRGQSDRHPSPPDAARHAAGHRRDTIVERDRRSPDPLGADRAAVLRAGDQDADRGDRPVRDNETRCAADQVRSERVDSTPHSSAATTCRLPRWSSARA